MGLFQQSISLIFLKRIDQVLLKDMFRVIAFALAIAFLPSTLIAEAKKPPNIVKDLHYGEVLFHFFQDDYFTSITHLLAAQRLNRVANHRPDDELLLGGLELSYGMHKDAGRIFARVLDEQKDDAIKNRAYYYLAKISYQRGLIKEASQYISNIRGAVHSDIFSDTKLLKAQVQMDTGDYSKAIASLSKWKAPKDYRAYAQHNLGIAYIKQGNVKEGVNYLRKVSKNKSGSVEMQTLRDKANLAAGLTLLQNKNPRAAESYLENVRLSSLYSDISLLSMGWAYSEQGKMRQAIGPWAELRHRNLSSPSVQEGLLALAYGYGKLGLNGRAVKSYEDAVGSYLGEVNRLEESVSAIKQGKLINALLEKTEEEPRLGWFWKLKSIPEVPEMRYLTELMAEHQFHEAIKNFRDLIFLRNNLKEWLENIDVYHVMLETRENRYQTRIPVGEENVEKVKTRNFASRIQKLESELAAAVKEEDAFAFVNFEERQTLSKIAALNKRISDLESKNWDSVETTELKRRLGNIRGALLWKLEQEYPKRKRKAEKDLAELKRGLLSTREVTQSLGSVQHVAELGFEGFGDRIEDLRIQIIALLPQLDIAYNQQSSLLERLAVRELDKRRLVMQSYHLQARTALAQAYDQLSFEQGAINE